jgi:hypothetical protein
VLINKIVYSFTADTHRNVVNNRMAGLFYYNENVQ